MHCIIGFFFSRVLRGIGTGFNAPRGAFYLVNGFDSFLFVNSHFGKLFCAGQNAGVQ